MDLQQRAILDRAEQIARQAHAGQVDKGGTPYIEHPRRVVAAMAPDDFAGRVVAWLHDVWEDAPRLREQRALEQFLPWRLLQALDAITRRPGEEYANYIARCMGDRLARRVKMADLIDNLDLSRLNRKPCPADYQRISRYAAALADLQSAADEDAMAPKIDPKIIESDERAYRAEFPHRSMPGTMLEGI